MPPTVRVVVESEECRGCGLDSRYMHPAGVVPRRWTCSRCGLRQDAVDETRGGTQLEGD